MPRLPSILSRVVLLHVVAIATTAIVLPLILFWLLSSETSALHERAMSDQAATLATYLVAKPNGGLSFDLPPELRAQYSDAYGRYSYDVLDRSGNILFSSGKSEAPIFPFQATSDTNVFPDVQRGAKNISGTVIRWDVGDQPYWIQVGEDLAHRDDLTDDVVANFFRRVSWITFPILLILLTIDIFIFRRAIRPLVEASSQAANVGPARTDIRLPEQNIPNEILPLVRAVNLAFERLDRGFRAQREFTGDAAHELRTPLAVLRARIDTLENKSEVPALRRDVEGMSRIVSQLLELAELDALAVEDRGTVDLRTICSDVAEFIAPLVIEHGRDISLRTPEEPVLIKGNGELLKRAIRNIVENALYHTPVGSTVEIELDWHGTIAIVDQGPGIDPRDTERIFERFWRADRSRTGGAGLGLSIVKQIVESHGGTVRADNRPSGGAEFLISLPLADSSRTVATGVLI
jgi:signal transduction histidine kinase